jgi:hypothetical protein
MIHKLKTLILSLSLLFSFSIPLLASAPALADSQGQTDINNCIKQGSNIDLTGITGDASTCKNNDVSNTGGTDLTTLVKKIINILSVVVGAVAVIMIIYGGFRYVTSAGNDSAVGSAKNTILYAVVGLVIVALAQIIVHFVLNNITSAGSSGGGSGSSGGTSAPGQSSPGGRGGV